MTKTTKAYSFFTYPRGIQRDDIRRAYNATLAPHLPEKQLTVAVSRPRNLRDRLCSACLKGKPGDNPSDLLTELEGGDLQHSPPFAAI